MSEPTTTLPLPPYPHTREGRLRRVGVELEMQGLDIGAMSAVVAAHVHGNVVPISRYEHRIEGDSAGHWQVELDVEFLKQRGRESRAVGEGVLGQIDDAAEDLLAAGVQAVVPMEVVSPPLPMDRLSELEPLIARLRDAGARGTRDGVAFAFGTHLNPELPDTGADTVLRYLQAFLCLHDWLRARARVDLLRRLTVYVDPFPIDYVREVLDPAYHPDQTRLIGDYLRHNPTRNRALDMLPLFAFLDPAQVRRVVGDPRVKPRPALHYRLPNCEIDQPGWGLEQIWCDWLQVERLVADPERLRRVCGQYLDYLERPLAWLVEDWAELVQPWLDGDP